MPQNKPELGEEVAGRALDAQEMRHLTDDGDADETLDEASHHRGGDEGGDPAHTRRAEKQEEGADQDCEGRGERIELCSSLHRDSAYCQRRNQTCRGVW